MSATSKARGPPNGLQVMIHHRHADRQRVVEFEADITDAVTSENDVDDGVGDACRDRVVSGCDCKAPAFIFPPLQQRNRDSSAAGPEVWLILALALN